ncbi:MAG: Asparagine synthetase (glutamine-hydrolyzing) 1 [Syntrophorhabdus sp. PtaU1.Bin002]|nr:MAG: Asparagine synthetase (glutamine-hydrolyzing) 1 [Syntrophorhabdus sp. PtaU1.Bin002]
MCGIAGIIDFSDCRPDEGLLRRMLGLIRHRGPDAFGIYLDNSAGLASTRLSILDLAGGDQPIHNEDQSLWIVYNGEVFNYVELRPELEARGHSFSTNTDTEVLLHLYEEKGAGMLNDLNGQFAVAIWDRRGETLFLARDRMGIRPLFYTQKGNRLIFASEIKALFADPTTQRTLDPVTLSDVFTCWTPTDNRTAFQDIQQLMPGHYAVFSKGQMKISRYWQLSFSQDGHNNDKPISEWTEELKELLHDACRIRLRADVPVGAYLSGGLDSTYISSLVKHSFNNRVSTFSVGFTDGRFDEAFFQKQAVQSIGTDHKMIRCTEKDIGEVFPDIIWFSEAPLLRTAPAPLFQLSGLVRENNFKVVLTGEGADEIFAGYDIFKEDRIRRFWAKQPDSKIRPRLLQRLYPDIFGQKDSRTRAFLEGFFRKGLSRVDSPHYSHMTRWDNTSLLKGFFSAELHHVTSNLEPLADRFDASLPPDFMSWEPLSRAQYIECTLFLSNYLLSSQGDRMAMAHAVEGRYPFLDYRVIEFACRMPPFCRLSGLRDKFILRKAATDLIPPDLAQRPKQPYRAPISRCFFSEAPLPYVDDLLAEESLRKKGYFQADKVTKLIDKIRRRDGRLLSERENMALVGILSTQLLDEMFIKNFPFHSVVEPENVKVYDFSSKT